MKHKNYRTNVTDREWECIKDEFPPAKPSGRKRTTDLRQVVNAIFYVDGNGIKWDALPHDFPPLARSLTTSTSGVRAACGSV